MEYILIAWFSMMDMDSNTNVSDSAYGYGFATSIVQEFNSEQACTNAGQSLQRKGVNTEKNTRAAYQKLPKWNWVCVLKGEQLAAQPITPLRLRGERRRARSARGRG